MFSVFVYYFITDYATTADDLHVLSNLSYHNGETLKKKNEYWNIGATAFGTCQANAARSLWSHDRRDGYYSADCPSKICRRHPLKQFSFSLCLLRCVCCDSVPSWLRCQPCVPRHTSGTFLNPRGSRRWWGQKPTPMTLWSRSDNPRNTPWSHLFRNTQKKLLSIDVPNIRAWYQL